MDWLATYPQAVVKAHLLMLPELRAAECLDRVAAARAATSKRATPQMRAWRRHASGGGRGPVKRASTGDLAALGIGVRTVPAKEGGAA